MPDDLLRTENPYAIGTRVRLKHDVDRYPHFIAPAGATGVVVETGEPGLVAVKLNNWVPGTEAWDGEVHWYLPNGDDPTLDLERRLDDLTAEAENAFEQGYVAGLSAYAWWKDGRQYVGTMGTSLNEAIERFYRENRSGL